MSLTHAQVGDWLFDDGTGTTLSDGSGNANHGSIGTGYTWNSAPDYLVFNGTTTNVNIPDAASLDVTTSLTLSFWMRDNQANKPLITKEGAGQKSFRVSTNAGKIRFEVSGAGTAWDDFVESSAAVNDNNWHHVMVSFDGSTMVIYIDGWWDADNSSIGTSSLFVGTADLEFGFDGVTYYSGEMGHVMMFNSPESDASAISFFNADGGSFGLPYAIPHKGFWPMVENSGTSVGDSSYSGLNGTLTLGSGAWNTGPASITFDGTTTEVLIGDDPQLDHTEQMAIIAWVKTTANSQSIVAKSGAASEYSYDLTISPTGNVEFYISDNGTSWNFNAASTASVDDGNWHMVTGVFDGANLEVYIDDQADGSSAAATTIYSGTGSLYLGRSAGGSYFTGEISHARVLFAAIGAQEVTEIFNQDGPIFGLGGDPIVADWMFLTGSGTVAYDSSGNTRDLNLNNGPTWSSGPEYITLDGINDQMDFPDDPAFDFSTEMSISTWVRTGDGSGKVIAAKQSSGNFSYRVQIGAGGVVEFQTSQNGSTTDNFLGGTTINDNTWHHIIVTFDGTDKKIFVDGMQDASPKNWANSIYDGTANFVLGAGDNGAANNLTGDIGHTKVWGAALSDENVIDVFNSDAPSFSLPILLPVIAQYPLDEGTGTTANDNTGNARHGTLTNGPTWNTSPDFLTFDGVDDFITVPDDAGLDLTGSISLSAWVRTTATNVVILGKAGNGSDQSYMLSIDGAGKLAFDLSSNGTSWTHSVISGPGINDGNWHLATGSYDGGELKVYIDGAEQGSNSASLSIFAGAAALEIGRNGAGNYFSGDIAQPRVMDMSIGHATVEGLFNEESGTYGGGAPGLAAYWEFSDGSGTNVAESQNSIDLTVTNLSGWGGADHMDFDGTSTYASATSSGPIEITGDISLSLWFQMDVTGADQTLIDKTTGSTGGYAFKINTSNKLVFRFYDGGGFNEYTSDQVLSSGPWYHAAVSYDGASAPVIYVDGSSTTGGWTLGGQNALASSTDQIFIGMNSASSNYFDGPIGHVRIYNSILTSGDVSNLFSTEAGPVGAGGGGGWTRVSEWWFAEGSGTSIGDSSGNGNHGTSFGGMAWDSPQGGIFDGTDDSVHVASPNSALDIAGSGVSFSFWAYFNVNNAIQYIISKSSPAGPSSNYAVRMSPGGKIELEFYNSVWNRYEAGGGSFNTGEWYHVAIAYDESSDPTVWVNDSVIPSGTWVNGSAVALITNAGVPIRLGAKENPGNRLNGKLANVYIYDGLLDNGEVSNIFGSENSTFLGGGSSQIAYWDFAEGSGANLGDVSGNSFQMTLAGTYNWGTGDHIDFDGSTGYATVGTDPQLSITADITIGAWIFLDALGSKQMILDKRSGGTGGYSMFISTDNKVAFEYYGSAQWNTYKSNTVLSSGQWYYVATTYDTGSDPVVYVDSIPDGGGWTVGGIGTMDVIAAGDVTMAAEQSGAGNFFNGKIGKVRLYNYSKDSTEINNVITSEAGAVMGGGGAPNLIGFWPGIEGSGTTLGDSSANSNHGTLTNGAGWSPSGYGNNFDGVNDYINVPHNASLDITTSVSIMAWFKLNVSGGFRIIMAKEGAGASNYNLKVKADSLEFVQMNGGTNWWQADSALDINRWYHVALTYDGSNPPTFYLDGNPISSHNGGGSAQPLLANTDPLNIGSFQSGGGNFMDGEIGYVRLYEGMADNAFIDSMRNLERKNVNDGMVALYKFNQSGSVLKDFGGGGHHGSVGGTANWHTGPFSLLLDGSTNYVSIADAPELDGMAEMTLSAWVKKRTNGATQDIIAKEDAGQESYIMYFESDDKLAVSFSNDGSSLNFLRSTYPITDTLWHNYVFTYDGTDARLVIDGNLDTTKSVSIGNIHAGTATMGLGASGASGNAMKLDGSLSKVFISRKALGGPRISARYSADSADYWEPQGALALDTSTTGFGGTAFTDTDSIIVSHFQLTANPDEDILLDTIRVKMTQGDSVHVDNMYLAHDVDGDGSWNGANDSIITSSIVYGIDSTLEFFHPTKPMDSIPKTAVHKYFLMVDLPVSPGFTPGDNLKFAIQADDIEARGVDSYYSIPIDDGAIAVESELLSGMQGIVDLNPGFENGNLGGPYFTDSDSVGVLHFTLATDPSEGVGVDSIFVKMMTGDMSKIQDVFLALDDDNDGYYSGGTDTFIQALTIAGDSLVRFGGVPINSIASSDTGRYLVMVNFNSTPLLPSDSYTFEVAAGGVQTFGNLSQLQINVNGTQVTSQPVTGVQGAVDLNVGFENGNLGAPYFTDSDSVGVLHFTLATDPSEGVGVDSIFVKMMTGDMSKIQDVFLALDDDNDGYYSGGTDTFIQALTIAGDSLVRFGGVPINSIASSDTGRYLVMVNFNSTPLLPSDSYTFEVAAGGVQTFGNLSQLQINVNGTQVTSQPVTGIQGAVDLNVGFENGNLGAPYFTDSDSVGVLHFTLATDPSEGVGVDSIFVKMMTGDMSKIQDVFLALDDDNDGYYSGGTDTFIQALTIAGDSLVRFGGVPINSIASSDTGRYLVMVNFNSTPLLPSDSYTFEVAAGGVQTFGNLSQLQINVNGTQVTSQAITGIQGAVDLNPGFNNSSLGGLVYTDDDSVGTLHFTLATDPSEGVGVDSIFVKMMTGDMSKVQDVFLALDDDNDGYYSGGTDTFIQALTIAGDSLVRFGGVPINSIASSDTGRYLVMVNFNSTTIYNPDDYTFEVSTAGIQTFGNLSQLQINVNGTQVTSQLLDGTDTLPPVLLTSPGSTPINGTQIDLTWDATSDVDVEFIRIQYRTDGTTPIDENDGTNYSDLPAATTAVSATGLTEATIYHFGIFAGDSAGNWSPPAATSALTPDQTNPTMSTLYPADDATNTFVTDNLIIQFSELVNVVTGNVTIKRSSDDAVFEVIDITTGNVTGDGTNTLTINPDSVLDFNEEYYVLIDASAVSDTSSNNYAGIASTTAWSFTTGNNAMVNLSVINSSDDAEETIGAGTVDLTSANLELVYSGNDQLIGIRFQNITIPRGALINSATIDFTAASTLSSPVTLDIRGELNGFAAAFTTAVNNISNRTTTSAMVQWNPGAWTASSVYTTVDFAPVIQEIVNQAGWSSGNALAIIINGDNVDIDSRYAESFDGGTAPAISIGYTPDVTAPIALTGLNPAIISDTQIDLAWNASSDPDASNIKVNYRTDGVTPTSETDGTNFNTIAGTSTSVNVTGLNEKTMYHFGLFVQDYAGNWGPVAAANDSTPDLTAPVALTGLGSTPVGGTQIDLTWNASSDADADSIRVNYRTDGTTPTSETNGILFGGLAGTATGVSVTGLMDTTVYHFGLFVKDYTGFWGPVAAISDSTLDGTAPSMIATIPTDNAVSVAVGTDITLVFDEPVNVGSGNVTIKKTSGDVTFEVIDITSGSVTGGGTDSIVINGTIDLGEGLEYYVLIDAGALTDISGNNHAGIASSTQLSFTVLGTPPTLTSTVPTDDSTGIPVTDNVVFNFDEPVVAATGNVNIYQVYGNSIFESIPIGSGQITGSGTATITVNPTNPFNEHTEYYVLIDATALDDTSGNSFAGVTVNTDVTFTTENLVPVTLSGLSPTVINGTQIDLAWNMTVDPDADSIRVNYRTDGTFPTSQTDGTTYDNIVGTATSISLTGLNDETMYHFGVFLVDSLGLWSGGVYQNDSTPDGTPPVALTSLAPSVISDTQIDLSWNVSSDADADSVRVNYRTDGVTPTDENDGTTFGSVAGTATNISVTGLMEKTMYHFGLFVKDASNNWGPVAAANDSTPDLTAPVALSGLGSAVISDTQIDLTWAASSDADADSIRVMLRTDGTTPVNETDGDLAEDLAGNSTGVAIVALTEKTMYHFGVFVKDESGNWGPVAAVSDSTPDLTAPAAISGLFVSSMNETTIHLGWNPVSDADADSIMVRYRTDGTTPVDENDGILQETINDGISNHPVTGLTGKVHYHFALFVIDSSGNYSAMATIDTTTPDQTAPVALTGLNVTGISGSQVDLAWNASSDADAEYVRVRYRTDGTSPVNETDGTLWNDLGGNSTSTSITGLSELTTYRFALFVADSSANWGTSALIDTTTPDQTPPVALTGLVTSNVSEISIDLTWNISTDADADSIRINYRVDGITPVDQNDGTTYSNLAGNSTFESVAGLSGKTMYHFGLFVKDSSGNWGPVAAANDSTPDQTSPGVITGLQVTAISETTVDLGWNPVPESDAWTIMIRYRNDGITPTSETDGTLYGSIDKVLNTVQLTGLTGKTLHNFALFVTDTSGNYGPGAAVDTTTPDETAPSVLTGLSQTYVPGGQVDLSWNASGDADAEFVRIVYQENGVTPTDETDGINAVGDLAGTSTSASVFSLNEKSTYHFGIFVADSSSNWSSAAAIDTVIPDETAPGVLTGLGSGVAGTQVDLTWTASLDADAEYVRIRYRTDGTAPTGETDGTYWTDIAGNASANSVTGLSEKTMYHFSLFVKDTTGNWSAAATINDSTLDGTAPVALTGLNITGVTGTQVDLNWNISSDADAEIVRVRYRNDGVTPTDENNGSLWSDLAGNSTSTSVTGLTEKFTYHFGMFVKDSSGNWSPVAAIDTVTPDQTAPAALSGLNVTGITGTQVDLGWNISTDADAQTVRVRYNVNGSTPADETDGTLWADLGGNATATSVTGLSEKIFYNFGLFVMDTTGNWGTAASIDTTTPDQTAPAALTGVNLDSVGGTQIDISWTPASDPDAEFIRVVYNLTATPADETDGTNFGDQAGTSSFVSITGLTEKTDYYIGLFVRDSAGNWSLSAPVNATTPDETAPAVLTGLSSQVAGTTIDLGWTASVDADAEIVRVRYRTDGTTPVDENDGTLWTDAPGNATTTSVTGLSEKTGHHFAMFVKDSSGNWSAGAAINDSTLDGTPPVGISGLSATPVSGSQIDLDWSPVSDADAELIRINYRTDGTVPVDENDGVQFADIIPQSTNASVISLNDETTYSIGLFVKDSSNNWSTKAGITAATLDVTAPVITVNFLSSTDTTPTLTGTVDDNSAVISVDVAGQTGIAATNNGNGTWELTTGLSGIADGTYDVVATATDASLNAGVDATTDELYLDATAPAYAVGYPAIGTVTGSSIMVQSQSNESGDIHFVAVPDGSPAPSATQVVDGQDNAGNPVPAGHHGSIATTANLLDSTFMSNLASETAYDVYVVVRDTMINSSGTTKFDVTTLDVTAPVVTIDSLATNDNSPQLTGTVDDTSANITVDVDTLTGLAATNNGDNTWTLADNTITGLIDGTYEVTVTATDGSGNSSTDASADELVIDATAPVIAITSQSTNNSQPGFSGTTNDLSAAISVTVDTNTLVANNVGDGTWTLAPGLFPGLADGTYDIVVTATDNFGNVGTDATTDELVINSVTPIVSINFLGTSDTKPALAGTVDHTTATINVFVDGNNYPAQNNGDGTWGLPANTLHSLADGIYSVVVSATDNFGNLGTDTTSSELIVDATAPVLSVDTLTTTTSSPELTGTVDDPTVTVSVTVDSTQNNAVNNGNGTWTLAAGILPELADGIYDVAIAATDSMGNSAQDASLNELTIDENDAPEFVGLPDTLLATEDDIFSYGPELADADENDNLVLSIEGAPAWLAADSNTLSGIPANEDVGTFEFSMTVSDGDLSSQARMVVVVANTNDAPRFVERPDTIHMVEDVLFTYKPQISDDDAEDSYRVRVELPWMESNDQETEWAGTAGNEFAGEHRGEFIVEDAGGLTDTIRPLIIVENVNDAPVLIELVSLELTGQNWQEDSIGSFSVIMGDVDAGDIIELDTSKLPDFIALAEKSSDSGMFQFHFVVTPLQKDTGVHNFNLEFSDIEGAEVVLDVASFVEEVNDAPTAVISSHKIKGGAIEIPLNVEDEDGLLTDTRFEYSLMQDSQVVANGVDSSSTLRFYPLLDGDYQLTVKAIDKFDLAQTGTTDLDFSIAGVNSRTVTGGAWAMLGSFGNELSLDSVSESVEIYHWVDDGTEDKILGKYQNRDNFGALFRGQGYWILSDEDITFEVTDSIIDHGEFAMNLVNGGLGWNQVSNPYPYPIDLSATGLTFFEWNADSADIVDVNGILQPWTGYWVQVEDDTTITLNGEPYFGDAKLLKISKNFRGFNNWTGRLMLSAGKFADRGNYFGAVPSTSKIAHNVSEPPKMGSHITLAFTNPESNNKNHRFATAYRNNINIHEEWFDFSVQSVKADARSAVLTLEGLDKVREQGIYIFLATRYEAVMIDESNTIPMKVTANEKHYSLVITDNQDFAINFNKGFMVRQNFPNPVRNMTTFQFNLPYRYDNDGRRIIGNVPLEINVFNMKGQKFQAILSKSLAPGAHQYVWRRPTSMPSGTYVFRLQAPGLSASKKMLLMR